MFRNLIEKLKKNSSEIKVKNKKILSYPNFIFEKKLFIIFVPQVNSLYIILHLHVCYEKAY